MKFQRQSLFMELSQRKKSFKVVFFELCLLHFEFKTECLKLCELSALKEWARPHGIASALNKIYSVTCFIEMGSMKSIWRESLNPSKKCNLRVKEWHMWLWWFEDRNTGILKTFHVCVWLWMERAWVEIVWKTMWKTESQYSLEVLTYSGSS
jgi:hypothetical protein